MTNILRQSQLRSWHFHEALLLLFLQFNNVFVAHVLVRVYLLFDIFLVHRAQPPKVNDLYRIHRLSDFVVCLVNFGKSALAQL